MIVRQWTLPDIIFCTVLLIIKLDVLTAVGVHLQNQTLNIHPYMIANYQTVSSVFMLTAYTSPYNAGMIPVQMYHDYHYARFAFTQNTDNNEKLFLEIAISEKIDYFSISPINLGIKANVTAHVLSFSILPGDGPFYFIIQINSLEKMVVIADLHMNIPESKYFNIVDPPYMADPTGSIDATKAIQAALDDSAKESGTLVFIPTGVFLVSSIINLRDNSDLWISGDGVIRSSPNISAQHYTNHSCPTIDPVLYLKNVENVTIRGHGTIDASGIALMRPSPVKACKGYMFRRRLISSNYKHVKKNVRIEGLVLRDATTWTVAVETVENVILKNLKVLNWKNAAKYKIENDGLDIIGNSHSLVKQNLVITVDDAMCAKADTEMTNVTFVSNVIFTSCAGNKAGMQARGLMSKVTFRDNDIVQCRRGVVVESTSGSKLMNDITFENIRIESFIPTENKPVIPIEITAKTAPISNVHIFNLTAIGVGDNSSAVGGKSKKQIVTNVSFSSLFYDGKKVLNAKQGHFTINEYTNNVNFN